jgi:hypothetical protein
MEISHAEIGEKSTPATFLVGTRCNVHLAVSVKFLVTNLVIGLGT